MKRILKKNQLIIAVLAIMIAAAGYLNYSGKFFWTDETEETNSNLANQELLDISEEDLASASEEIESQDSETEGEAGDAETSTPGEAVLTSAGASSIVAEAKVTREQVRSKSKEELQQIIDSDSLEDAQKQEAVDKMVEMTGLAEKETAAETLLASKGFADSVVSISGDSVDVVISGVQLTDANLAQIQDIVTRKTGVAPENVVINPVSVNAE